MKLSKFVNAMLVFGGLRSTNLTVSVAILACTWDELKELLGSGEE